MSDDPTDPTQPIEPVQPADGTEPTRALGDYETVGPVGPDRGSRRGTVIAAVAVLVVAVLGGGAFAAYSWLNGDGPQPADVLPSSTVAVVSVDLDPSAGQKIAAIKSIRKFPALKKSLGLQADDDLREYVFDKVTDGGDCKLDFDRDVKPWLGKRAAFAGVDLGGPDPTPVIALQISDPEKARKGFGAIVDCTDPDDFAFVVGDDYVIASDSAKHAQEVLDRGKEKPLADDAAYQKWTGEAGDAGVLNFYVGKQAASYGERLLDEFSQGFTDTLMGGSYTGDDKSFAEEDFGGSSDPFASAKDALKDFQGLGGTVRFAGGGMEVSLAGGGISQVSGLATVGKEFGDLPADTAIALGFGVSKDYAKKVVDQFGSDSDSPLADAEDETGLDLPEDLQTLLGHAVTLSLGGDVPASPDDIKSPEDVPAGLVIHGDADKIKAIIAKVEDHLGMHLSDIPVVVDSSGDKVALSTSDDYAGTLLKDGSLGSEDAFRDAVPNADDASGVLYVDFDSPWRAFVGDTIRDEEGADSAAEFDANTKPLKSLGLSSWQDGDVTHALLKLTTD